jgi:hypothetical protein
MRRLVAPLLAVALLITVPTVSWSATKTDKAQTKQIKSLQRNLTKALKRIKTLERVVAATAALDEAQTSAINGHTDFLDCVGAEAITAYGDPAGAFGYQWQEPPAAPFSTTALDLTARTPAGALTDPATFFALTWTATPCGAPTLTGLRGSPRLRSTPIVAVHR